MKKTLSIFAFLMMGLGLFAQEAGTADKPKPTLDELRDSISKIVNDFFDEVLDLEVAYAAVQARQISNVGYGLDNALFQNGELRDTFEVLRQVLQSELFIKAAVHYDHFWTRLIERSNYSPRDAELENRYGDGLYDNRIYFDVVFTPAWDTLKMDVDAAREVGSIAWECSIDLHGVSSFRAEFSDKEMAQLARQPVSGHKYGNIGKGAKPDVNMGVMGSLGWLAEKFGYSPADDTTNVRYVRFYALNVNDRTFDAPGNALLGGNYDNTPVEGRKYLAPWQSAAGNDQTLYAHVERKDKKNGTGDTLAFKTTAGGPVSAERLNDTTYRLSLPGLATMGGQGIQATYSYTGSDGREKAVFAGQVNIAENKAQKMDLVLVEVNGNTLGEPAKAVQDTLDAIYKPAGVTWTIRKEPLKVKSKAADTDNLDDGETKLLTNYTGDMDAVIDAYRKVYGKPDKNTCYLFLVGRAKSGTGKCGYMPLKRQFGFIFTKSACGSKGELKRTVAHELGHGPFRLYHTFSAHSQYVQPEGETDNLMDYSNGTRTRKYQWDLIHDPESMIALFQDEEEGAFVIGESSFSNVIWAIRNIRCAVQNGAEYANLYFNTYTIPVKIGDLVTAFNWAVSDVSDEEIEFYLSNDGEINLDYFEDDFDTKNIVFDENEKQVILKGEERYLYVRPYDGYSDKKTGIYSFIKTLFDETINIKDPTSEDINGMELDDLRYLSICQLALLNDGKREETLKSISEQTAITAKDEKLVINLLKTTKDKSAIYGLFQNDKVALDLYNGLNTYKQAFVYLFNWICEANWTDADKQGSELIFLGTDENGIKYQLSEVSWFDDKEENKIPVWNLEGLGGGYTKKFNSPPSAPIRIAYFDGNTKTVSTIMVDYLRSQENKEEWAQAFFDYLNGIGLSSAGRLLAIKSTPALIRFLAVVEFGKTNIDIVLTDESLKTKLRDSGHQWFVDNWPTISTSIDVATFGTEIVTNFAKKGDDLSKVLRDNGQVKAADEIEEITTEAKRLTNYAREQVDEALGVFYTSEKDDILTELVEEAVLNDDYDKLARMFGLDESINGKALGRTGNSYELTASNQFPGEDIGKYPAYENIKYFDPNQRKAYEVLIKDGELFTGGSLLKTKEGRIIFVLDGNGNIYSAPQKIGELHHSSFLSGADVATAGEFKFIDDILEISPNSGHYIPSEESLKYLVEELVSRGVNINKIKIVRNFN